MYVSDLSEERTHVQVTKKWVLNNKIQSTSYIFAKLVCLQYEATYI